MDGDSSFVPALPCPYGRSYWQMMAAGEGRISFLKEDGSWWFASALGDGTGMQATLIEFNGL